MVIYILYQLVCTYGDSSQFFTGKCHGQIYKFVNVFLCGNVNEKIYIMHSWIRNFKLSKNLSILYYLAIYTEVYTYKRNKIKEIC